MSGWTYILTNARRTVLYTGVTADLATRIVRHKCGQGSQFCRKYNVDRLVYSERHDRIEDAIAREKAIKAWKRAWKQELIEQNNPEWVDLFDAIL